MRADPVYFSVIKNDDLIRIHDGCYSLRNDNFCDILPRRQCLADLFLRCRVDRTCRIIEDQDFCLSDQRTRDAVNIILQKNVLFSGTVRENLKWGNVDASDKEIWEACRAACADEFLNRMPDGLDTVLEQGASNLSGGQKQRLCIARALLKKPRILILDDSTSAVDTATDAKIRHSFAEKIPGTTVFIIAQRISSVENADKVLVLDNGRVSGFDTPANLLKTNAIYQDVYNSQTKGSGDFDEKGGEA